MAPRFHVGGTVPIDGYVYVPRRQDRRFLSLLRSGNWVNVVGSRTMGKSSLVVRGLQAMQSAGEARIAYADVAGHIGEAPTVRLWLELLGYRLAAELDLSLEQVLAPLRGKPDNGPATLMEQLLVDGVLARVSGTVILALDEVDFLSSLPYAEEIVAAFQTFRSAQARLPDYRRLICCFAGLRPLSAVADDTYRYRIRWRSTSSPLGVTMNMEDFAEDDASANAIISGLRCRAMTPQPVEIARRILHHTGGQPYLTVYLADRAARIGVFQVDEVDDMIDRFLLEQRTHPMELLASIERFLLERPEHTFSAVSTYLGLLEGDGQAVFKDSPGAGLLWISGLIRPDKTSHSLQIKSPIFHRHFDIDWAHDILSQLSTRREIVFPRVAFGRSSQQQPNQVICVLNTGGTIGMVQSSNPRGHMIIAPPKDDQEFMDYNRDITNLADIDYVPLFSLDSINITPNEWTRIAQAIYDRYQRGIRRFIIAHGTDTMAYTASAVALALGKYLDFPVVFTGAQTTPDIVHGDARSNLYRACMVALHDIPEVVIAFGHGVFRACRAVKIDDWRYDAFDTLYYPQLAHITEVIDVHWEHIRRPPPTRKPMQLRAKFSPGVLHIVHSPGLEPEFYLPALRERTAGGELKCRGVIIETPGGGTVATRRPFSFLPLIEAAVRAGVPVLVLAQLPTPPPALAERFLPTLAAVELGAIPIWNMTRAAAVAKFRWVLAEVDGLLPDKKRERVETMMEEDYVGEKVPFVPPDRSEAKNGMNGRKS